MSVKRHVIAALSLGLVVMLAGCSGAPNELLAKPVADLQTAAPDVAQAQDISAFGERLFAAVAANGDKNPVISPLSVFYALGMAYEGARGDTAAAFQQVLGLTAEQARQIAAYLLATLAAPGQGTTLNTADSVWLDSKLTAQQTWVDAVSGYYKAQVFNTDLQAPDTLVAVNKWINDATNGLIPQMLDRIDSTTVVMLINALYMKAAWAQAFDTNLSSVSNFTVASGQQVRADFMTANYDTRSYFDTPDAEGVVIPYQDGRLAFLVALPKGTLTLGGNTIAGLLADAKDTENVGFSMPKFDTEFGLDLLPALVQMGLEPACDLSADFSGLGTSTAGPLYIGLVAHKVSMSVGEKGTEAAAATVIAVDSGGSISPPAMHWINFDHPYLYAVVDTTTGIPLFIGQMDDPSLAPPAVS